MRRFTLFHKSAIETHPLQVYASALIFSPTSSLVRQLFRYEIPVWLAKLPMMEESWYRPLMLEGHVGSVLSVAFSLDSQMIASASADGTVRLWSVNTGECLQRLEGHSGWALSVTFSPTNTQVASASDDRTIWIWDIATGRCEQILEGHDDWVWSVDFSHDGRHVASASKDQSVRLWDVTTGQCLITLRSSGGLRSAIFSPDGRLIASASDDGTLRLWKVATGQCDATIVGHDDAVSSLAFHPDSRKLASGSYDCSVKLWDIHTGECLYTFQGHRGRVECVAFSPSGTRILSASSDRHLRLLDADTGRVLQILDGHRDEVNSVAFSPDGRQVVSASKDRTVGLWDIFLHQRRLPEILTHDDRVRSVAFSSTGNKLASASDDHTVLIWDVDTCTSYQQLTGHTDTVDAAVFSPDDEARLLASGSYDGAVKVWDLATGSLRHTIDGHTEAVTAVAFSSDGRQIISASADGIVRIWDAVTAQFILAAKIGIAMYKLSYLNSLLITDVGVFDIERSLSPSAEGSTASLVLAIPATIPADMASDLKQVELRGRRGFGFNPDSSWITWNGHELLWLPSPYRPSASAVHGSIICHWMCNRPYSDCWLRRGTSIILVPLALYHCQQYPLISASKILRSSTFVMTTCVSAASGKVRYMFC